MNKILVASVALLALGTTAARAADMAVKAPPPLPPPVFSWTGFYVGANIGGAWSDNRWRDTLFLTNFNNNNNGVFIGGGQIGGYYQIGQFVIGGEWEFDWAGNNNNSGNLMFTYAIRQLRKKTGSIATRQRSLAFARVGDDLCDFAY